MGNNDFDVRVQLSSILREITKRVEMGACSSSTADVEGDWMTAETTSSLLIRRVTESYFAASMLPFTKAFGQYNTTISRHSTSSECTSLPTTRLDTSRIRPPPRRILSGQGSHLVEDYRINLFCRLNHRIFILNNNTGLRFTAGRAITDR